jgi:CheY-specific phosphatase CheX
MQIIQVDENLVNILVKSTRDGLAMAGVKPLPVGVSRYVTSNRDVSAIVGMVGTNNGAVMLNAGTGVACHLASQMLGEDADSLNPQTLDCLCELANIIAGQSKAFLSATPWKVDRISCPSVVVGNNYFISHYKLSEMPLALLHDRIFSVSLSLLSS